MHQLQQKWHVAPPAPATFFQSVHEHPLLAQVLYNRGLRTAAEVDAFLNGADVATINPYKLADMAPAVQRILRAIRSGETICVYGDFDVDGVSSTALLVMALQAAGGVVGPYIPDRVDEGYGLNLDAITRIARFLLQEALGKVYPAFDRTDWLPGAVFSTAVVTAAWGGLIWTGSIETISFLLCTATQTMPVTGS